MMKSHRTQAGILGLFLLSLVAGLCLVTCEEAPFEPNGGDMSEPIDYRVWFWDGANRSAIYSYRTISAEVDSILIPWMITSEITVSNDGRTMFVPFAGGIGVFDADSEMVVTELPYTTFHGVAVSPNGEYIAIPDDSLVILRSSDYSVAFVGDVRLGYGRFNVTGSRLWSAFQESAPGAICTVTWENEAWLVDTLCVGEFHNPYEVIPTPDETKMVMTGPIDIGRFYFAVYDLGLDSITFYQVLSPGHARLAMTPDGEKVYYGNPGSEIRRGEPEPTSDITEFDIELNQITRQLDTRFFVDSLTPEFMPIGSLVITPDGRTLVGLEGPVGMSLLTYNLFENKFSGYRELSGYAFSLTVQDGWPTPP